jgi:hypothetical protein
MKRSLARIATISAIAALPIVLAGCQFREVATLKTDVLVPSKVAGGTPAHLKLEFKRSKTNLRVVGSKTEYVKVAGSYVDTAAGTDLKFKNALATGYDYTDDPSSPGAGLGGLEQVGHCAHLSLDHDFGSKVPDDDYVDLVICDGLGAPSYFEITQWVAGRTEPGDFAYQNFGYVASGTTLLTYEDLPGEPVSVAETNLKANVTVLSSTLSGNADFKIQLKPIPGTSPIQHTVQGSFVDKPAGVDVKFTSVTEVLTTNYGNGVILDDAGVCTTGTLNLTSTPLGDKYWYFEVCNAPKGGDDFSISEFDPAKEFSAYYNSTPIKKGFVDVSFVPFADPATGRQKRIAARLRTASPAARARAEAKAKRAGIPASALR